MRNCVRVVVVEKKRPAKQIGGKNGFYALNLTEKCRLYVNKTQLLEAGCENRHVCFYSQCPFCILVAILP